MLFSVPVVEKGYVKLPTLTYHNVSLQMWRWLLYLYIKCFRNLFRQLWEDKSTVHVQNVIGILFTPFMVKVQITNNNNCFYDSF